MGNSFVLFDVSIVISRGQFHCGNIGHTQNTHSPWVKSYFPEGKRASGTATKIDYRVVTMAQKAHSSVVIFHSSVVIFHSSVVIFIQFSCDFPQFSCDFPQFSCDFHTVQL